ncbi:conjugal transfer protein TraF [Klebsiella pneumoniae]|uniref:conjugal transfer protein TraF n=1 Tax=Klebsiella pneumoniae TaxID=573 RepID=UPI003F1D5A44
MKSSLKNIAKTPLAALALSLALAGMAQAGTLDEVKSLWDPRGISGSETASPQSDTPQAVSGASQPRWLRLSNGKQVDLRDWKTDQGQAEQLGVKFFPAMMLVNPKSGQVKPLSYGFISQDDLAKQFLYVSSDFKPNF